MSSDKRRVILGIDPGSICTGWGIVEHVRRRGEYLQYRVVDSGSIKVPRSHQKSKRIHLISLQIANIMGLYKDKIDEVFIEDIFLKLNTKTTISLAQIQGSLMGKSYQILGVNPALISPARVRARVGAGGRASKAETAAWVRALTGIKKDMSFDESDAIAIALGGHFEKGSIPDGGRRPNYEET